MQLLATVWLNSEGGYIQWVRHDGWDPLRDPSEGNAGRRTRPVGKARQSSSGVVSDGIGGDGEDARGVDLQLPYRGFVCSKR